MTTYWYSVEQVLQLPFTISIVSRYCVYRSVCFCFVSFVVNVNVKENFCDIFFVAFLARWYHQECCRCSVSSLAVFAKSVAESMDNGRLGQKRSAI